MIKFKEEAKPLRAVMYYHYLHKVGEGYRLSDMLVRSFLTARCIYEHEDCHDVHGEFYPTALRDETDVECELPDITPERIAVSVGLTTDAVRKSLRTIGDTIDISDVLDDTGYFVLKTNLRSNIVKTKKTDTYKPLKGLAMVVYSYLVSREDRAMKKNPMTKGVPVIDTWESRLAKEMKFDKLAITRQIWKLESMGFVYRFYDSRHRPLLWINDKPKTSEEMLAILNKHYNGE